MSQRKSLLPLIFLTQLFVTAMEMLTQYVAFALFPCPMGEVTVSCHQVSAYTPERPLTPVW